jgi:hypothetical protein
MKNYELLNQLLVYNPQNKKIHLGSHGDGGYVLIDGYEYDFYITCGIETNVSFDKDFCIYKPNINGLAFDGTVNKPSDLPNNIIFYKKNISNVCTENTTDLNQETNNYENIFLKMDIEGHEWRWIKNFKNFNKCKQIILESHGYFDESWTKIGNYNYEEIEEALKKLNETHYLVHFHGNNCGGIENINGILYPTVGEMTFIRKSDCIINGINKNELPIDGIDFKNNKNIPDMFINMWPFVSK